MGLGIPLLATGCSGSGSGGSGGTGSGGSGGGGTTTSTPAVSTISPTSVTAGSAALTLTVNGSGFVAGSVVQVGGTAETTAYVSASQLTATVPATQIANGTQLAVTVVNGTVSSTGAPVNLEIDNPSPTITSISPAGETAGTTSAVVVVTGTGFDPSTVIDVNGAARTTTFTSGTQVSVTLTAADLASAGSLALTAANPTPGGGTSAGVSLSVVSATLPQPQIQSVSPTTIYTGSPDTTLSIYGYGFTANSVAEWNGTPLQTTVVTGYYTGLTATVPASDLTAAGTAAVTVNTPGASPSTSSAVSVTITNPPAPTLSGLYPAAGPIGAAIQVQLQGSGFVQNSAVKVNGTVVPSTWSSSSQITANIPASALAFPGNVNVTVSTPAPGGGNTSAQTFSVYLPIAANDIVFNSTDGLLYASVPTSSGGASGNSVAGIDPNTGNVTRQIQVGSNPNKLALSSDGTQLFVGLDGAASVAQVDLTDGKVVNQFSLGGGEGIYNPPLTALYMAAVPGSPNSVAVATAGGFDTSFGVTIYDSGVARSDAWTAGEGPMSFGSSASTLYVDSGSTIEELTVGASGVTAATALASISSQQVSWIQYDKGNLYLSSGQVVSASTGTLEGTFYSTANTVAAGPIVSDSTLGRAFIAAYSYTGSGSSVLAFDESSFNLLGSLTVSSSADGYLFSYEKIVRWGQNGLAINTSSSYGGQPVIFIFQSPLVKDLSSSPADLAVSLTAPASATTGNSVSWVATVKNLGPDSSDGATVAITVDPSLIVGSVKASTGTCGSGATFSCDLGTLANGASATVTVDATPTQAGTLAASAAVTSVSYDPTTTNNQSSSSTKVTGSEYGAVPSIASISPNLVQAGAGDFTVTVNGAGFNSSSTVNLGTTALATTFVSATQLTADVPAAQSANYGWAAITVSNPTPGGGVSQIVPLTIYEAVSVPASGLVFDPYAQWLYATVPGTSTTVTGNSVVQINPVSGAVGTPVAVGSQPTVMTETTDGKYLYIGLSGANSLAQFNLLNQSLTATIPLALTQYGSTTSMTPTWVAAMPGSDTTLAVDITNGWGQFGILDISGSTGTFRSNLSQIYNGVNPVWADASHLYAYDSQTSGAEFYRYSVNASGLTETDGTTLEGMGGYQGLLQLANALVYGAGGGIINPSTTPPSQVATLSAAGLNGSGYPSSFEGFAADPSLGKEFLMLSGLSGTSSSGLARYDLNTYLPEAVLDLPAAISGYTNGWTMMRWGQDGLALLGSVVDYATNQTTSMVILLRGPFVAPQELGTGRAATLTASSSTSITHGSGNTILTLTGTNFAPGVAVTWNGSYRTTTVVNATHVTVAIPASDVANAGSSTLVATNPGAAASNTLNITVD